MAYKATASGSTPEEAIDNAYKEVIGKLPEGTDPENCRVTYRSRDSENLIIEARAKLIRNGTDSVDRTTDEINDSIDDSV